MAASTAIQGAAVPAEHGGLTQPFGEARVAAQRLTDGSVLLSNEVALPEYPRSILDRLDWWARSRPADVFLAERHLDGWHRLSYGEAAELVNDRAAALLSLPLTDERPLMLISSNAIEHALIVLGAMRIGVPVAVLSPTLVGSGDDLGRFQQVFAKLSPGALYLGPEVDSTLIADAIKHLGLPVILFSSKGSGQTRALQGLRRHSDDQVRRRYDAVSGDAPAKILFTSGSTGAAKGVVVTQRMMCSNAAAMVIAWPFLVDHPPVLVDWLPWSHTFGGNCCFNLALFYGGSLYIDDGKPTAHAISRTIENLRQVRPNVYFNVPLGFAALLPHLESDELFASAFFSSLFFLFNAGAALSSNARARLQTVSKRVLGRPVSMSGGWGSTETAPMATVLCFDTPYADNLGIPMPGTTIKMVPVDDKWELRIKGPNVMPAYWRDPESTAKAFDGQGFYCIGDSGRLADPKQSSAGIRFCGRIAENFKLASGTWVNVSALRSAVIDATKPYVQDVVITGHGRDALGVLLFPAVNECRQLLGSSLYTLSVRELVEHPIVIAAIRQGLWHHGSEQRGSSTRIARFAVMHEPPRRTHNEITEKGSLNQAAVLEARAAEVEHLHRHGYAVLEEPHVSLA